MDEGLLREIRDILEEALSSLKTIEENEDMGWRARMWLGDAARRIELIINRMVDILPVTPNRPGR